MPGTNSAAPDTGDAAPTRREARRAELLDAAIRVIRRGGGRVAMEDIAAEAGISRPILYRHFGDATGLYAAVADRFNQELLAKLRASMRGSQPGEELLRRQIRVYIAFIAEEPDLYRFLTRQIPPGRPRAATHGSGFSRMIADGTAEHLESAGWNHVRAVVAADLFVGGMSAVVSRWVEEPTGSYEELADRTAAILWNGFQRAGLPVR
ncbi:MAG TPA: TetR/AcrR family transcriptional regulator [Acidimicrobiales bacterium]|nr:TetR/AcrR family transcriptional regulator [Acidimicrobiales bacterium]